MVPLLGSYPHDVKSRPASHVPCSASTVAKLWSVNVHQRTRKMWCVYTMECHSVTERRKFCNNVVLAMSPEDRMPSAASSHGRTPAATPPPERPRHHTWREHGRVGGTARCRGGHGWEGGEVLTRGWALIQPDKLPTQMPATRVDLMRGAYPTTTISKQSEATDAGAGHCIGRAIGSTKPWAWVWLRLSSQCHGIPESLRNKNDKVCVPS